jgi:hypothetical protein
MTTSVPPGKIAVSMDLDKKLWRSFGKHVEKKYGTRNKARVVEKLIFKYMKKQARKNKDILKDGEPTRATKNESTNAKSAAKDTT